MPVTSPPETETMARVSSQVTLRIDPDLYVRARSAARADRRSLTQWIALAMEAKLAQEERRGR